MRIPKTNVVQSVVLFAAIFWPVEARAQQEYKFGIRFRPINFQPVSFNRFSFQQPSFRGLNTQSIQFERINFPALRSRTVRRDATRPLNRPLNRSVTAGPLLDSRNNQREQRLQLALDAGIRPSLLLSHSRITEREQRQQSVHFVERQTEFSVRFTSWADFLSPVVFRILVTFPDRAISPSVCVKLVRKPA